MARREIQCVGNLHSFRVEVSGDDVYVHADPNVVKSRIRQPKLRSLSKGGHGVVIIGAGAGGGHAIEGLREAGYEGKITIIGQKEWPSIDRTKISKALITDPAKIMLRKNDFLEGELGVTLKLGKKADAIDFKSQVVKVGGEEVPYDKLIVATGGTPRTLPLPGASLSNIHVLRDIDDAVAITKGLPADEKGPKPNLVIVGSSFIGMELAVATAQKATVKVIGMEKAPFERILGVEVGNALRKVHESKGTKFFMEAGVDRFEAKPNDATKVGAVVLKSGEKIEADIVVLGVGVAPATEVLKASTTSGGDRIKFQQDGSVEVNEKLELVGVQNVYAIGDIATYPDPVSGELNRIEHWNVASNMGRCAAFNIANPSAGQRFDKVPVFWSAQGQQVRYANGSSLAKKFDGLFIDGSLVSPPFTTSHRKDDKLIPFFFGKDDMKFAAWYTKGDEVVALCTVGRDPMVSRASELFKLRKMPKASEIKSGKNIMDIKLE
ncbi:hypothetical protein BT69DRAFT_1354933 [Atractiella rhizophila]|nr:hypothetical protein BT69DRAFT_1354933 [Atractiella rhizophila]